MPTIGREDLRLSGYYGWRARGHGGPVIQDLRSMGNLGSLFSLAYDRGGKVVEMIHNRMGPERFFAFFRKIYHDYAFKIFHYEDLKRELMAFDPAGHWDAFLEGWLIDHGETDWAVEDVDPGTPEPGNTKHPVTVVLRQKGKMVEPTVLLCQCGDRELWVPIWPERGNYEVPGAKVENAAGSDRWVVRLDAPWVADSGHC